MAETSKILPMQKPGTPPTEAARLATLQCLNILDTPPSESYDRITRLAAQLLDVPIALVSLVDEKRQWFKSRHGLDASQTPREISFCGHVVYDREMLYVPDATQDVRFAGNPLVLSAPDVRAYIGVPLFTREGHVIGTLCAIDTRARQFDERRISAFQDLGKVLEGMIQAEELSAATERAHRLAAAQERLFRDTFEQAAVGIVHTSLSGQLLRVNRRTCSMLGYDEGELSRSSFIDITHEEDLARSIALFKQLTAGEVDQYEMEQRLVLKSGGLLWAHMSVSLKRSSGGEPDYIITIIEDVSARKQAEAQLLTARDSLQGEVDRQTLTLQSKNVELQTHIKQVLASERSMRQVEHRLRSIADSVPANIGYWNRDLTCDFANSSYREHFGLSRKEIVGLKMVDLVGETLFSALEPHVVQALAGHPQRFERTWCRPDGVEAIFEVRYLPDFDGSAQVRGFFVLGTDVTESRRERLALEVLNSKLTKETTTDFLTGVSNRRVFSERSEEASRHSQTSGEVFGLILLDLDNFKQINDVYGHGAGDDVLRCVGRLLKSELRSHRDVAARLGGEEFAVLCFGGLDEEMLRSVAERLRYRLSRESVPVARGELSFTASFGIALSARDDRGWKDIYARADMAMYEAKAAGKDQVKFAKTYVPGATGRFKALRVIGKGGGS